MQFNSKKFECIRYGPQNTSATARKYTSNDGSSIKEVEHVRDLGIIMSRDGTFREHITNVTESARSLCGWVLRTFRTRDKLPMLTLWKSLIRSKLEYCCQLWCPSRKGDIQMLEQIQRNYIRKIRGTERLNYWEQLQALGMHSLERRRERYLIIYTWRIIEGQVPNISPDHNGIQTKWHIRRGRTCRIPVVNPRAPTAIKTIRYSSFAILGPQLFNTLPAEIRNLTACTVDSFKRSLDKYLKSIPDEPQIRGYTAMRRAESNSLLHMSQLTPAQSTFTLEEPVSSWERPPMATLGVVPEAIHKYP